MTDLRTQLQATLGNTYTLERELGGGGMSRVFVAEELSLGRKVVVKVLPPDLAATVNVERLRESAAVGSNVRAAARRSSIQGIDGCALTADNV